MTPRLHTSAVLPLYLAEVSTWRAAIDGFNHGLQRINQLRVRAWTLTSQTCASELTVVVPMLHVDRQNEF